MNYLIVKKNNPGNEIQAQANALTSEVCRAKLNLQNAECIAHYLTVFDKYKLGADDGTHLFRCPFGLYTTLALEASTDEYPLHLVSGLTSQSSAAQNVIREFFPILRDIREMVRRSEYSHYEAGLHSLRHVNEVIVRAAERILERAGLDLRSQPDMHAADADVRDVLEMYAATQEVSNAISMAELSRDPDRIDIAKESVHPRRVFLQIQPLLSKQIDAKKLRIVLPENDITFIASTYFRHVLWLLLENAVKYAGVGSDVFVKIAESLDHAEISVENYGTILPSATHRKQVFYKGYQGNTKNRGSGIGLWLAALICRRHDMSITFDQFPQSADVNEKMGKTLVKIVRKHQAA